MRSGKAREVVQRQGLGSVEREDVGMPETQHAGHSSPLALPRCNLTNASGSIASSHLVQICQQLHQHGPASFFCGPESGHDHAMQLLFQLVVQLLRGETFGSTGPLDVLRSVIMSFAVHPGDGPGDETFVSVFSGNAAVLVGFHPPPLAFRTGFAPCGVHYPLPSVCHLHFPFPCHRRTLGRRRKGATSSSSRCSTCASPSCFTPA